MGSRRLGVVGVFLLALPLAAWGRPEKGDNSSVEEQLVGKWKLTGKGKDRVVVEFGRSGVYTVTDTTKKEVKIKGTWKLEGDRKFKASYKVGDKEHTFAVEIVKLTDSELVTRLPRAASDTFTRSR